MAIFSSSNNYTLSKLSNYTYNIVNSYAKKDNIIYSFTSLVSDMNEYRNDINEIGRIVELFFKREKNIQLELGSTTEDPFISFCFNCNNYGIATQNTIDALDKLGTSNLYSTILRFLETYQRLFMFTNITTLEILESRFYISLIHAAQSELIDLDLDIIVELKNRYPWIFLIPLIQMRLSDIELYGLKESSRIDKVLSNTKK